MITERQLLAFRRFVSLLPHGQDRELVLLKGHILIEEQVRVLIDRRLTNPDALREPNARLDAHQAIHLAKAFFPPELLPELWRALSKLNRLRNDIAHSIVKKESLKDRIDALVKEYPAGLEAMTEERDRFEIALWSMFDAVSELADTRGT